MKIAENLVWCARNIQYETTTHQQQWYDPGQRQMGDRNDSASAITEINESEQGTIKLNKMAGFPSEGSDRPAHPPNLIKVSLTACRSIGSFAVQWVYSEDSDQIGRTGHFLGFALFYFTWLSDSNDTFFFLFFFFFFFFCYIYLYCMFSRPSLCICQYAL